MNLGARLMEALASCALLAALACSGPTDVVGVVSGAEETDALDAVPPAEVVDPSAVDDASGATDVALLLAGRPVVDWVGDALEWPLATPLGELFAETPTDDRGRDDGRAQGAPWASRRVAQGTSRGGSGGPDDADDRSSTFEARLLILDEDEATELLELMASAEGSGDEEAVVFQDERGDVYQVALEGDERTIDDIGCFGRMRREPFECAGRGSFD